MQNLIPVFEAVEHHYFLNGEAVHRTLLVDLRILVTGYNSDRVSNEKLLDVPGAKIEQVTVVAPLGSDAWQHTFKVDRIDTQYVYLSKEVSWGFIEARAPFLRKTSVYVLLDFSKMETRNLNRKREEPSEWKLEPYER